MLSQSFEEPPLLLLLLLLYDESLHTPTPWRRAVATFRDVFVSQAAGVSDQRPRSRSPFTPEPPTPRRSNTQAGVARLSLQLLEPRRSQMSLLEPRLSMMSPRISSMNARNGNNNGGGGGGGGGGGVGGVIGAALAARRARMSGAAPISVADVKVRRCKVTLA